MYIVEGIDHRGQRCKPLKYATLDQAMTKLRDLVEADELDASTGGDGPMFVEYTLRIEPLPGSSSNNSSNDNAGTEARSTDAVPAAPHAPWQPRLTRD